MRTWPALCVSGLDAPADNSGCPITELVCAALVDHPVAAIEEVSADQWRIFFSSSDDRRSAARAVSRLLPSLSISTADVADEDWAARSQASLRAIRVDAVVVAPPWDASTSDGILIVIQPSMGFGTGHHATTRLCLAALQRIDLNGRRLIDVGTGSGVLALAASLLGAAEAIGIDDDPDAVHAAAENLALNPTARAEFLVEDLRTYAAGGFDVVTANLTGGLLASAATRLQNLVPQGGMLILSGLMSPEVTSVLPHFDSCTIADQTVEDEWVCVTLVRSR
jgi:ribosomal protein L11 methyltransferase